MKKSIGNLFFASCFVVSGSLLLFACNKNSDNNIPATTAALSISNLAPDNAGASFVLSGNVLPGSPLGYPAYAQYQKIYPGTRNLQVIDYVTGATLGSPATFTYDTSKYYSAYFIGANNSYRTVITKDNYDSLVAASGKSFIRYINAIPDSSKPKVTLTASDSVFTYSNVKFGSLSNFTAVKSGNITVAISNDSTIQASRSITVEPYKVYTITFIGLPHASDTAKAVKIKYITNGTLNVGQSTSASAQSFKSLPSHF